MHPFDHPLLWDGHATLVDEVMRADVHFDVVATSLGARRPAPRALELAREHPVTSLTVTDAQAVAACLRFADAMRVLVEPACGAALAAVAAHPGVFERFRAPLIEVCGGLGVSLAKLADWKRDFGFLS